MGPAPDWKRVLATLAPAFTERAATYDNTDEFVAENYADMRAARLFSALVPRELGGSGLAYSEACVLIRGSQWDWIQLSTYAPQTDLKKLVRKQNELYRPNWKNPCKRFLHRQGSANLD